MRRRLAWIAAALALGLLAWFGWPTPYRSLPVTPAIVNAGVVGLRVHRLTGRVELLSLERGQWVRAPRRPAHSTAAAPAPPPTMAMDSAIRP